MSAWIKQWHLVQLRLTVPAAAKDSQRVGLVVFGSSSCNNLPKLSYVSLEVKKRYVRFSDWGIEEF